MDQPCIVLINAGRRKLLLAHPTRKLGEIQVTPGRETRRVKLPAGEKAGSTVEAW